MPESAPVPRGFLSGVSPGRLTGILVCLVAAGLLPAGPDCLAESAGGPPIRAFSPEIPPPAPERTLGSWPALGRRMGGGSAAGLSGSRLEVDVSAEPARFLPAYDTTDRALLGRYRRALEKESRRAYDKNPSLFVIMDDEEGYPLDAAHRSARKIFGKANSRILSGYLENIVEDAPGLRRARDYVEGVRLDVRKGGGIEVGPADNEEESSVAASFHIIALGDPRIEMRSTLPGGIETRIELSLSSPGIRTKLECNLGHRLTGSLSGGVEDSGEDRWISAGLGIRF